MSGKVASFVRIMVLIPAKTAKTPAIQACGLAAKEVADSEFCCR